MLRIFFNTGDPKENKKMLGLIPNEVLNRGNTLIRELSQSEYVKMMVRDYEQRKKKTIRAMSTTGQKKDPDFDTTERVSVGGENLSSIRAMGYAVLGSHPDQAHGYARLGRMTARWSQWCEDELEHQMGYYKHTSHYTLKMISEGHLWQDLYPTLCVDSNHTKEPPSKATDGYITNLEGDLGSHFPQSWSAKLQQVVTTNSGESESIAWSGGAKQLVKLGAIFEKTILGYDEVVWVQRQRSCPNQLHARDE